MTTVLDYFLAERGPSSGWIFDALEVMHYIGEDGFVQTRRGKPLEFRGSSGEVEIRFGGPGGLLQLPAVRYEGLGQVAGAAERLLAHAAMNGPALAPAAIDAHFDKQGMTWEGTILLAGERLAVPHPEYLGRWESSGQWHGLFVYGSSVIRVTRGPV